MRPEITIITVSASPYLPVVEQTGDSSLDPVPAGDLAGIGDHIHYIIGKGQVNIHIIIT